MCAFRVCFIDIQHKKGATARKTLTVTSSMSALIMLLYLSSLGENKLSGSEDNEFC